MGFRNVPLCISAGAVMEVFAGIKGTFINKINKSYIATLSDKANISFDTEKLKISALLENTKLFYFKKQKP